MNYRAYVCNCATPTKLVAGCKNCGLCGLIAKTCKRRKLSFGGVDICARCEYCAGGTEVCTANCKMGKQRQPCSHCIEHCPV